MTQLRNICLLILLFSFVIAIPSVDAQRKRRKKKRPDKEKQEVQQVPFQEKLWYGGGFALGFAGNSDFSQFVIGVSPMVGYKVTEKLSFGPRFDLQYTAARQASGNEVLRFNAFNYGVGAFGRFKFLQTLFLHGEFGYLNYAVYDGAGRIVDNKLPSTRIGENQLLLGLGYFSGYPWGTEFSILYNFLLPNDTTRLPFELRFGFYYKF